MTPEFQVTWQAGTNQYGWFHQQNGGILKLGNTGRWFKMVSPTSKKGLKMGSDVGFRSTIEPKKNGSSSHFWTAVFFGTKLP